MVTLQGGNTTIFLNRRIKCGVTFLGRMFHFTRSWSIFLSNTQVLLALTTHYNAVIVQNYPGNCNIFSTLGELLVSLRTSIAKPRVDRDIWSFLYLARTSPIYLITLNQSGCVFLWKDLYLKRSINCQATPPHNLKSVPTCGPWIENRSGHFLHEVNSLAFFQTSPKMCVCMCNRIGS